MWETVSCGAPVLIDEVEVTSFGQLDARASYHDASQTAAFSDLLLFQERAAAEFSLTNAPPVPRALDSKRCR